ncbi:MAG: hypothetical protein JWO72_1095, partial [Caulobacteraceae bacterium]|nr:hypothetical protein [Caulobacteraceae bacterium]
MRVSVSRLSVVGGSACAPKPKPRLLPDLLDRAVAEHPDWPAIDFLARRWT